MDTVDHAHHVYPNQSGDADNTDHAWLRGVDNCVILCDACHDRVHENGRYATGAVAPPEYFKHSHGRQKAEHKSWVIRMQGRLWQRG